jgi:hypothetical protein
MADTTPASRPTTSEPINPENNHLPNEPIVNNNRPRANINNNNNANSPQDPPPPPQQPPVSYSKNANERTLNFI